MRQTIIGEHIRRISRNRAVLGVVLIASALAICGLNSRYVDNWVYKQTTQHRTNFVPTGKTYAAVLFDRTGAGSKIDLSQGQADSLLGWIATKRPWALNGFDKEVAHAWATGRASVVAAVDERRNRLRNAPQGSTDRPAV